jgi:hypothetical protein
MTPGICAGFERQLSLRLGWDDYRFSLAGHRISVIEKLIIPLEDSHLSALFTPAAES